MKYPKKADIEEGLKMLTEFLTGPCRATPADSFGTQRPSYSIATVCGPLRVTPYFEPRSNPWIACKFEDVEAAVKHFDVPAEVRWQHQLNHHSGKWNFQGSYPSPQALADLFRLRVSAILPNQEGAKKA